ncbi:putative ABC multidrug transporter [Truncatella angustata]|uniref:ABC multidrug transporter n=1 Tax=Truncatella angustata TaxID=152316 RepID=A0A9P8UTB7_9PEZI|nr:putative ABC multidrug transporter [Truncatella angustata]KAH6657974.1 putative ABC multidrug transporter [Truncatella angustata]
MAAGISFRLLLLGRLTSPSQIVAALLLGAELANTVLTSRDGSSLRNSASIAAAVLSCVSTLSVMAITYAEHCRSLRSSSFLSAFLSITTLFNVARARSYISRGGLGSFGALQIAIAIIKLVLVALEEVSKQSLFQPEQDRSPIGPETRGGFWNRSLFVWVNNTLLIGFKTAISVDELPEIGLEFSTDRLSIQFQKRWEAVNKSLRYCLPITSLKALAWPLVAIVVPRLCFMAFTFAQPFLLHTIVRAVGQQELSRDIIGGLIGATGLVYFGLAVAGACYTHAVYRCLTMNRGMLVSAIFKQTLELDLATAKKSAAVTLMSTDVDSIEAGFVMMHDLWAGVLELGIGVFLLARYVGAAAFLVIVPAVLSTASSHFLAKKNGPARKDWNQAVQTRVSATNHVLGQVKSIKMTGLAPFVVEYLQDLRVTEVDKSKDLRKIIIYMHALAQFFTTNTPVLVIAGGLFWTNASKGLDAADTFATLSLTSLVSAPMTNLLVGFPQAASLLACFSRIQDFLLLKPRPGAKDLAFPGSAHMPLAAQKNAHAVDSKHGIELRNSGSSPLKKDVGTTKPLIEFDDAYIAPSVDAEPVLQGVSLKILPSTLTVVVGPVGSGKTTLVRALLGEAHISGTVIGIGQTSTGYCDQVSWLRNISIQDNIVGPAEFDEPWYNTVLKCCLLQEDLREISGGDKVLAGSGGASLSGGQKQRVALARAVYARNSMIIMDDVFSALDHRTSQAILDQLLGSNGVLRALGTTVIMATHSLDHLALATNVLVLDGKGNVDVRSNAQYMANDNVLIEELRKTKAIVTDDDSNQGISVSSKNSLPQEKPNATLQPNDTKKLERQRGDLGLYRFYFFSSGIWHYLIWMLMAAINMLWSQMPYIFLRIWLGKAPDDKTYFAGYATLGVTSCLSSAVMLAFYMLKVAPTSAEKLHRILLEKVMRATLGFLSSTDSGSLLNRFSQDMSIINQTLPMVMLNFSIVFFDNLVSLGIIVSGANYAAVVIPFLFVTVYLVQHFYLRTSRQMRHLDLEAKSPLYTQLSETAAGVQHIRAFSWRSEILSESFRLVDSSQKPYYYMFCIQRWLTLVLELNVMVVAVVLVTLALTVPHTSSASAIGLAMLNVITFGSGMANVIGTWTRMETSLGAIARLRSFLEETPAEEDPGNEPELPKGWPLHGKIKLEGVCARYNPQDTRQVLDNISLIIEPGQKVGVVGRTGSGKSSLVLTLLHLLHQSGSVTIDDINTSDVTRQHLRSRITVIAQDPVELQGTVRFNLVPFDLANALSQNDIIGDAIVQETLLQVGLRDQISANGGLEADFSTLGLSQGQRQLFCLARAVLHHRVMETKIVLMDEATSSVDMDTDREMQAVMTRAFSECTVITVAHRFETLQDVDLVLELENGRLVRREERKRREF